MCGRAVGRREWYGMVWDMHVARRLMAGRQAGRPVRAISRVLSSSARAAPRISQQQQMLLHCAARLV